MNPAHQLYGKADPTAPASIKDSNGVVVLGLCKLCGKGEAELDGPCNADATKVHRMDMMVGDLKVFFEWHPKTGDKDIHTIVLVPEYEIRIELAGNWHAPIYVEQAIMVYLQAMSRQLLSSTPLDAFKLGELHGLVFGGKARKKAART